MIDKVKEFIDLLGSFAIRRNYNMLQFAEDEELLIGATLISIILDKSKKTSNLELMCEIENLCNELKNEKDKWSRVVDIYGICNLLVKYANNDIDVDYDEIYGDSRLDSIKYGLFMDIRSFILSTHHHTELGIMYFALSICEALMQRDRHDVSEWNCSTSRISMIKCEHNETYSIHWNKSKKSDEKLRDSLLLYDGVTMKNLRKDLKSMRFTKMLNAVGIGHGDNNDFILDDDEYVDYEASDISAIVEEYGTYAFYQNVGNFKLLNVGEVCSNESKNEGFLFFATKEQVDEELDNFLRKNNIRINNYFEFDNYFLIILENDTIDLIELVSDITKKEDLSLTDCSLDDTMEEWIIDEEKNTNKKMESDTMNKKIQLTINSDLAILRPTGDYIFMTKEGKIENVGKSVFDINTMPLQVTKSDLEVGDIIESDGDYVFVRKVSDENIVEVINLDNKIQQIVEEVSANGGVPTFTKLINPLDPNSKVNEIVRLSVLSKSGDTVALNQMLNNSKQSAQIDKLATSIEVLAQAMTVLMQKQ